MELQHDNHSAPANLHSPAQDTLTVLWWQLYRIQSQLSQLRLKLAEEPQSSKISTSSAQEIEQPDSKAMGESVATTIDQPTIQTDDLEVLRTNTMDSPFLIQTRAKINDIKDSLQKSRAMPSGYDSGSDDVILAWHKSYNTHPPAKYLCDKFEMLLKEEAEEIKYLHRLRMDHQHQLAMTRQSQGQGEEGVTTGLEHLAKATSQLAESVASEKSLATIEAKLEAMLEAKLETKLEAKLEAKLEGKLEGLLSEHSTTVSRMDKAVVPEPAVNKSPSSSSSSSPQTPRMQEKEVTSPQLIHLQRRIEVVRKEFYNTMVTNQIPSIEQLSKESKEDPEILILWKRNIRTCTYSDDLCELLKTLLEKEEAEREYLSRLAVAG
ncbi:hypothetical protein BGZ51_009074 [Haplosporangium sp. Z 767]|nr:hypothetical protein BGZ51_009074 [Haplosporangium sp. Z 767]